MNSDLEYIQKYYGDKMMQFCHDYFSSALAKKGTLSKIFEDNFAHSHNLYDDLMNSYLLEDFKAYIISLTMVEKDGFHIKENKTPQELVTKLGYTIYEFSEEGRIKPFKKQYLPEGNNEPNKKGRKKIKRVSFAHVEDLEQSTSLTDAFEVMHNLAPECEKATFEVPGYVKANDGKWYKYNYEINNVYYCPDNIIIDNGEIKRLNKKRYLVMDYFVLDLEKKGDNNRIMFYDRSLYSTISPHYDSFPASIDNIAKISVVEKEKGKEVVIIHKSGNYTKIGLDSENNIIDFLSEEIHDAHYYFLNGNTKLRSINLPNLVRARKGFLFSNRNTLSFVNLPKLIIAEDYFLFHNQSLRAINLPSVVEMGDNCLVSNTGLKSFSAPYLEHVGDNLLYYNENEIDFHTPNLDRVGSGFLHQNKGVSVSLFRFFPMRVNHIVNHFFEERGNARTRKIK